MLLSLAVVLVAWVAFLHLFAVSPLMRKGPLAVGHYLFGMSFSARNRAGLLEALAVTLGHAEIGLGLGLGIASAILIVLSPAARRGLLPVTTILRSVPPVAMTPLIVLVSGRGAAAVGVIGATIVFFPTVVNVKLGVRSLPPLSSDLIRVHGGGAWMTLRKVGLPSALPALFASIRLSLPAALVGALLTDWLATGDGLGYRMQRDIASFRSADLWSVVVLVILCSLTLYTLAGLVEQAVLSRHGVASGRSLTLQRNVGENDLGSSQQQHR